MQATWISSHAQAPIALTWVIHQLNHPSGLSQQVRMADQAAVLLILYKSTNCLICGRVKTDAITQLHCCLLNTWVCRQKALS